ncbi:DUF3368 domain-containing protein [Deltaproteobacteria bacterium TL4]
MIVVADSSPLIALATCEALELLCLLFQDIRIPRAVYQEVTILDKPHSSILKKYFQEKVEDVKLDDYVIHVPGLNRGELEAMAVYKHLKADLLLIDEQKARKIARRNNIQVTGSLGVLIMAKEKGLISEIAPFIKKLRSSDIFYSIEILEAALLIASEENPI